MTIRVPSLGGSTKLGVTPGGGAMPGILYNISCSDIFAESLRCAKDNKISSSRLTKNGCWGRKSLGEAETNISRVITLCSSSDTRMKVTWWLCPNPRPLIQLLFCMSRIDNLSPSLQPAKYFGDAETRPELPLRCHATSRSMSERILQMPGRKQFCPMLNGQNYCR